MTPYSAMLGGLIRHRGVKGCLVVGEADGLVVDSTLQFGVNGTTFAALTASLFRKARRAAQAAGFGDATFVQLDAEQGRVCAVGRNDLVLVVVAEPRVNLGLVRVDMLKAAGAL
ncbi:MAG TPA: roadblock/LC7 domain-containing protein [Gemmatimonadaceae bacterium]|nr:roadblock/LC7 domain-containing protein [Gemmatimonadaceae bacterium]